MDGLFGDGLVDVLCCGGDSLEEDLRWGPRLGALVDLVEFEDGVTNGGVALFKIVEALSGGAFFFSTSVELKTKGAGGGGAGREMMHSNTSLPAILTPKHFLAVSAICFDRSDFACRQSEVEIRGFLLKRSVTHRGIFYDLRWYKPSLNKSGGRSARLIRPFEKNSNLTIIGPTRTL